jgi:predicted DNA binding protein
LLKQLTLAVKMQSPYAELASKYGCRIKVTDCKDLNSHAINLLLEIEGDKIDELMTDFRSMEGVRHTYYAKHNGNKALAIIITNIPSYCRVARDSGSFCLSCPLNSSEAGSDWKLLTNDARGFREMFEALEEIGAEPCVRDVASVHHSTTLTGRQREILHAAVKEGYFEFPRKTDLTELAEELSISPATLDEILRRAQHKIATYYLESVKA